MGDKDTKDCQIIVYVLDFVMYYPIHSYRFVSSFNKCIPVCCNARTIGKSSYQTQQPVLNRKHLQFRGGVQNSERHLLVHAISNPHFILCHEFWCSSRNHQCHYGLLVQINLLSGRIRAKGYALSPQLFIIRVLIRVKKLMPSI